MSALLGFYVVVILSLFSWKTYSFQSFRHIGTFQHHVSKKVVQRNSNLNALGPSSAFVLGSRHLVKEATLIFNSFGASKVKQDDELPGKYGLSLSNNAVKAVEQSRLVRSGPVKAHPIARYIYEIGCNVLDAFFDNRPISRFWFLETIARVPYFAYTSMLHFYESVGWWRQASLRRVHDAEEWNELHHLLIMENLGGDKVDDVLSYFEYIFFMECFYRCGLTVGWVNFVPLVIIGRLWHYFFSLPILHINSWNC